MSLNHFEVCFILLDEYLEIMFTILAQALSDIYVRCPLYGGLNSLASFYVIMSLLVLC